jgi:hypothetical protein
MNLRHIDPGSTDWMDAMLEGELHNGRLKPVKREPEVVTSKIAVEEPMLAAGASGGEATLSTHSPPGSR